MKKREKKYGRCILDKLVMVTLLKKWKEREREKRKKRMIMKSILALISFTLYVTLPAPFSFKLKK
jgi:uncharacterized membrane protein YbaN (DUF454 family)